MLCCLVGAGSTLAQEPETDLPPIPPASGQRGKPVEVSLEGVYIHQFRAEVDGGGNFSLDRVYAEPSVTWTPDQRLSVSFSFGYSYDNYDFSGDGALTSLDPWGEINGVRFSAFVRYSLNRQWTIFGGPTIRSAVERGAIFSDGLTGGGFVGALYRFSDKLAIGPGVGVLTQIEDNPTVFPVLLVDWSITETLSLRTGQGLGASRGPGVSLVWEFADQWELAVGGRYEWQRFRLDDGGPIPSGVGQEQSLPFFAAITWKISPDATLSVLGGVNFLGNLRLENKNGDRITDEDYDPAPFAGVSLRLRF